MLPTEYAQRGTSLSLYPAEYSMIDTMAIVNTQIHEVELSDIYLLDLISCASYYLFSMLPSFL